MLSAGQKISENGCPELSDRYALLSSAGMRSAVNARKGLFQSSTEVSDQYKKGYMGTADGFDYLTTNLFTPITTGTASGAHTVTTTSTTGATTLAVTGTGTQTIKAGTVFTIAGTKAVHPITKVAYPYLQQFVVTADATAVAGAYTLSVSPTIYGPTSGSLQNVDVLPTSTSVITFLMGTASTAYGQNISYQKSAFRRVSVPLYLPSGSTDMAAQETNDGHTIRVTSQFNILTGKEIMRLDYLGGLAAVRPEWACRIIS
jgi:hypothetical protein